MTSESTHPSYTCLQPTVFDNQY